MLVAVDKLDQVQALLLPDNERLLVIPHLVAPAQAQKMKDEQRLGDALPGLPQALRNDGDGACGSSAWMNPSGMTWFCRKRPASRKPAPTTP